MEKLPVDAFQEEIVQSLFEKSSLVLSAATGTGKSTRVPQFLSQALTGQILLLEPRRVAARSIAKRISKEMGVMLGAKEVGYQIRFENRSLPETKLKIITEGILLQILQSNPFLEGIGAVILDEFHERNIYTDLALTCCREIQKNFNPTLKILVMSATLDSPRVAEFLGAKVLEVPGTQFPVKIVYSGAPDKRSREKFLDEKIEERLKFVLSSGIDGDILIFLPGWSEINRAYDRCHSLETKYNCKFLKLHSSLESLEQDLIFKEFDQRKVIFSTNIAETSLTIPGIKFVIDSGLEKIPEFDADLLESKLKTGRISLFSAKQRTGRAGRTSEGVCYRLWSQEEEDQMTLENTAQIRNSDLSPSLLSLMNWRGQLQDFEWFESPPRKNYQKAQELLEALGFVNQGKLSEQGKLTLGLGLTLRSRKILSTPVHEKAVIAVKQFVSDIEKISLTDLSKIFDRSLKISTEGFSFEQVLLGAYPDRVGRVGEGGRIELVGGVGVEKNTETRFKEGDLLIAYGIEFQKKAGHWDRQLKNAIAIKVEDLKKVFPHQVKKRHSSFWDERRKKVRVLEGFYFKDLPLERGIEKEADPEAKAQAFAEYIQKNLSELRQKFESLDLWMRRFEFILAWYPQEFQVEFSSVEFFEHSKLFLQDYKSIDDIQVEKLLEIYKSFLSPSSLRIMEKEAPELLLLPSRVKPFRLRYEAQDRVVVSGRIKEFFGVTHLPLLAGGRVKILAELLAPNYRPVQITADLEGFWTRTYPEVKKELKARYPKHFD